MYVEFGCLLVCDRQEASSLVKVLHGIGSSGTCSASIAARSWLKVDPMPHVKKA